jgi:2-keto-4-pentenoate hydratase
VSSDRFADLLVAARNSRRQLLLADLGTLPATAEEAYRIGDRVADALGWFRNTRATAWKVGAASVDATPIAVPLAPAGVVRSPARFAAGTFHKIGIEAEIAFRFRDAVDIDAVAANFAWARVIGELVVTIEVVDSRISEGGEAPALVKLADAQSHGALVVGDAIGWQPLDWRRLRAVVRRNGNLVADTRGGHPLGDPTLLLPWFVRHVAQRTGGVRAGDLVTAGTWVGIVPAQPGDAIEAEFDGVGRVEVGFG